MKIVVLTRTWRISPGMVVSYLLKNGYGVEGIILEERSRMIFGNEGIRFKKIWKLYWKYGFDYSFGKLKELVLIKFHYLKRKLYPSWKNDEFYSIEEVALVYPLKIFKVESHNSSRTVNLLKKIKPDVVLTINARILGKEILKTAKWFINLHLSLLPKYGGMDSIFWALYHGENEIGVTIHKVEEKLDSGEIIAQEKIPVSDRDNEQTLYFKALKKGREMILDVLRRLEEGRIVTKRMEGKVEYFGIPTRKERKRFKRMVKKR
ncbi:MAG TPA: hypothetical protein ENF61_02480 [Firmicutes bacterium]|nr:hypothetical protein [Bacillota bacterium]